MNNKGKHRILFVCHGNICRSPMAEFVMKDLVEKAGLEDSFLIESAATSTEEIGNSVYPPARRKLVEHGISCEGKTYTPKSFAKSLGLDFEDYVSLTSYTHHPFNKWFIIEAPYKWRLKPSYNLPINQLMDVLDKALDDGYTVAWGGDVSGNFTRTGIAMLPDSIIPTQELRQEQWNNWEFTYDHVMLIYGKALDEQGKPYYLVKNSWGKYGQYEGIWYMSRDFITLNTTYLFLNRHALPKKLREDLNVSDFN